MWKYVTGYDSGARDAKKFDCFIKSSCGDEAVKYGDIKRGINCFNGKTDLMRKF